MCKTKRLNPRIVILHHKAATMLQVQTEHIGVHYISLVKVLTKRSTMYRMFHFADRSVRPVITQLLIVIVRTLAK